MACSEFPPAAGGISNYVYKLSVKLTERGHNVTVVTRGSYKGMVEAAVDGIRVFRVPYLHLYPIHIRIHQIFQNRLLKSLEPDLDLIHVHHPTVPLFRTSLPVLVTAHSSLGLPGVIAQEGFWSQYSGKRVRKLPNGLLEIMRWYLSRIERGLVESADQVTAVSRTIADELLSRYGRRSIDEVEVLGNGVDVSLFVPGAQRDNASILYAGRLSWSKGLVDLVKAAKLILDEHPGTSFRLAGEGPLKGELKQMAEDMGMGDKFVFMGQLDLPRLIQCYQAATVFVLPTYYEGMPTSLLEAMACGAPVVTTNVGSIPDVVQNNQNGIIVPPGDPGAIASAVLSLLEHEGARVRMGQAARKTVEEHYSWDKIVDGFERSYQTASRGKTVGARG